MGKIIAVAIHSIVAGETLASKLTRVVRHKRGIRLTVAFVADGGRKFISILMTIFASKRKTQPVQPMSVQGKAQRFVRKVRGVEFGQRSERAAMFGMAVAAGGGRIIAHNDKMQTGRIQNLQGNILMALRATLVHRRI